MNMLKKEVIRGKKEFSKLYKKGKSIRDRYVVLIYLENGLPYTRKAFLASKKVGNSVVRHHITRLIREVFRLRRNSLKEGLNIIVVARAAAKDSDYRQIESAFVHLCGLHNIAQNCTGEE